MSKSAVSRRFVARTSARLTTWRAPPRDGLALRFVLIEGLYFRDHVIVLALEGQGLGEPLVQGRDGAGVRAVEAGATSVAPVCASMRDSSPAA